VPSIWAGEAIRQLFWSVWVLVKFGMILLRSKYVLGGSHGSTDNVLQVEFWYAIVAIVIALADYLDLW
jgi:hypothetical protein